MGRTGRVVFILEVPHPHGDLGLVDTAARAREFRVAAATDDTAQISCISTLR